MPRRRQLVQWVVDAIGPNAQILDAGTGWPSQLILTSGNTTFDVDLHVGLVHTHARRDYERRFQNPGQDDRPAVSQRAGATALLVGYSPRSGASPILVIADAARRLGNAARFSVLFPSTLLDEAAEKGWAEYVSGSGETITALHAPLLPAYLASYTGLVDAPVVDIQRAIEDAGTLSAAALSPVERARIAVLRVARDASFSRRVIQAYGGRCAFCGMNRGLVQGAHIYPATAPGSTDATWNGLALCPNHHLLFDRHSVFVRPNTLEIVVRPDFVAAVDSPERFLIDSMAVAVRMPNDGGDRPRPDMFDRRYAYFADRYAWTNG